MGKAIFSGGNSSRESPDLMPFDHKFFGYHSSELAIGP
jgi:hypothetical protein